MIEVIPTINAPDWPTVKERFLWISPFAEWVEIDISDGRFTKTKTWNNPPDLKTLEVKNIRIAVHLMVNDPEKVIQEWIAAGVRRIIAQYEGIRGGLFGGKRKKIKAMANLCKESWVEFGLSLTTETPVAAIDQYLPLLNVIQVLAVDPGPSGQAAKDEAFTMVETLRGMKGGFKIEWDGGVTLANVRKIKNAGADLIAAASAIFGSREPERALEALKRELLG